MLGANPDRKERVRRRHLMTVLAPAMSARTIVVLEGPHDLEAYGAVARRQFVEQGVPLPAAYGVRLMTASGSGGQGGKQELLKIALLANELGLGVRVVVDQDKPDTDDELIDELCDVAELVVRLPKRMAVERTIVAGLSPDVLRATLATINDDHKLNLDVPSIDDTDLADRCVWALKQKNGLHGPFVEALPSGVVPPLAAKVLETLRAAAPSEPLVTLVAP